MSASVKHSQYRLRVYQMPDGTVQLVFGSDVPPSDGKLLSDHDVIETTTVIDHIEPTVN